MRSQIVVCITYTHTVLTTLHVLTACSHFINFNTEIKQWNLTIDSSLANCLDIFENFQDIPKDNQLPSTIDSSLVNCLDIFENFKGHTERQLVAKHPRRLIANCALSAVYACISILIHIRTHHAIIGSHNSYIVLGSICARCLVLFVSVPLLPSGKRG